MPHISACIGSIELACVDRDMADIVHRAIQAWSSSRVRTVRNLLRSTGVFPRRLGALGGEGLGVRMTFDSRICPDLVRSRASLCRLRQGAGRGTS